MLQPQERAPETTDRQEDRGHRLDPLARRARRAAAAFAQYSQEQVDAIVHAMVLAGLEHAQTLAALAVEETGLGLVEDKVVKNMVATEFVYDSIRDERTVGVIRVRPGSGVKEVAEPVGVVLGVTPITNPTSTVIFKSLMIAKTRNAILFCPHPRAQRCSNEAARIMYEAGLAAGAPEGFIGWVEDLSQSDTRHLMRHPEVSLIDATGGPGMVAAAYGSGKPALGVGSGNVPCYIHGSADVEMAVVDILTSKTFDNGTICASEQTVLVDRTVHDAVLEQFRKLGAHVCSPAEVTLLEETVIDREGGHMQPNAVGQSAERIAAAIGLEVPAGTKLLIAPLSGVGRRHPLSCEKLFPVLGILPVDGEDEAINAAMDVLYYGGVGHTASIFSRDPQVVDRYADALNAGRIIVNSPSSVGALGGVYNELTPTFSFGCGTGGGNSTIENVTVKHYMNVKHVADRTPAHQWFRAPEQIYFNLHALENLRDLDARGILIITSQDLDALGLVDTVRSYLPAGTPCHVFDEVEVEPTFAVVHRGVEQVRRQHPDHLIALGGGSVLDAAKAMRLFVEHPELDFHRLETTFLDPRKRVVRYPHDREHALRLIAVPTTSGTGSEVTPYAVISDPDSGRKVPLYDHSLTPDMAILDPQLVVGLPPAVTADTGIDALTHALEAIVSVFASDYTDALAMEAGRSVFEHLPKACEKGSDLDARTRLHNAACMAGLAFANAFVGVNHALAHSLGAAFKVPHGRANAVFLPHTIRYNAAVPSKFMPFPNVRAYVAHEKYARFARSMGWTESTTDALVERLVHEVWGLLERCHVPTSIAALGIDHDEFETALPGIVKAAFDDISVRSNPRMPLILEMEQLLRAAWDGPRR